MEMGLVDHRLKFVITKEVIESIIKDYISFVLHIFTLSPVSTSQERPSAISRIDRLSKT